MTDAYERAKRDDEAWEREHDSREKIERDIRGKRALNGEWVNFVTVAEAIGWLDRQAAITRRETLQNWQDAPNVLDRTNLRTIAELQSKVDELQVELVATKKSLGLAQARVHELQAELDALRPKRTIEDALFDFWGEVGKEVECGELEQCVCKYADELRGMGVRDD